MKPQIPEHPWTQNLALKLLSLALAFGLWLYVNSKGQVEVNFAVPLEVANLADNLVVMSIGQKAVDVRLKGRESMMSQITTRNIRVSVDLSHATVGEQWITLSFSDVQVPLPVEVSALTPHQVRVVVEHRMTRPLRVVADFTGEPPAGVMIEQISIEPAEVTISGGESAFNGLTRLRTQPIDLTSLTGSSRREVRLDLGGRNLEIVGDVTLYATITVTRHGASPPKKGS